MCSRVPSFDFFVFLCLHCVFVWKSRPCCVLCFRVCNLCLSVSSTLVVFHALPASQCLALAGTRFGSAGNFFTLIQKFSWWLCNESRTFTYSPLIAWLSLPHRHDKHITPHFGCQSLLYGAVGWSLHPYWEKAQWLIYARQVKRPIK